MTSVHDPLVGHALDGRYEIVERLARGGMATVYRGLDRRLGREVAIKVMRPELGDDANFAAKFDSEARAAARLSHPHVVSVFDQGTDHDRPYIVMEYVPGQTLRQVISDDAPMDPEQVLGLVEPVLSALAAAHEAGLVHRDVKPENVLISDRGQLKVADFGLSRAITNHSATAASQGVLIGTVSYLPPELVLSQRADTRCDVYSVGVMMWEMLVGRKPHSGDNAIQVVYAHVHQDIPEPSKKCSRKTSAAIPDYLDALVHAMTRRDPDLRPGDAEVALEMVRTTQESLSSGVTADPDLTAKFTAVRSGAPHPPGEVQEPNCAETTTTILPASPTSPVNHDDWTPDWDDDWAEDAEVVEHTPTDTTPSWLPVRVSNAAPYRRRRRLLAVVFLALLLLGGLTYGGWYFATGRYTTTPQLVGLDREQAKAAAAGASLNVQFDEAWSEDVAAQKVISTDPAADARVVGGSTVKIVISRGPERFEVPTLVGSPLAEARANLQQVELAVGKVVEVFDEKVPAGEVLTASLKPGERVKRNTAVDLTVSKGREPIAFNDHAGAKAEDAVAALKSAGFTVELTKAHHKTVAAGLVISQTPKSGTAFRGDKIVIQQSLGPVMVDVPNVKSMGIKQATSVLQAKGFKVTSKPVTENYLGLGYVSYAEPGFGAKAPEGSTIVLYVV